MLESGMVEVGLIRAQSYLLPPDIRPVMTIEEHMMAYFHKDHETLSSSMERIPLYYLKDLPISISQGLKHGFIIACEQEGFTPHFMNISASRSTSQMWASDKKTISIMAASSNSDDGDFCMREITGQGLASKRMFAVDRNRKLSSVAETFLQFCRQHPLMDRWMQGTGMSNVLL